MDHFSGRYKQSASEEFEERELNFFGFMLTIQSIEFETAKAEELWNLKQRLWKFKEALPHDDERRDELERADSELLSMWVSADEAGKVSRLL